jgi:hypothetical protein
VTQDPPWGDVVDRLGRDIDDLRLRLEVAHARMGDLSAQVATARVRAAAGLAALDRRGDAVAVRQARRAQGDLTRSGGNAAPTSARGDGRVGAGERARRRSDGGDEMGAAGSSGGPVPPAPPYTAPTDVGVAHAGPTSGGTGTELGSGTGTGPGSGAGTAGEGGAAEKAKAVVGEKASEAVDTAKAAVSETTSAVKDQARDLVGEARTQVRGRAEDAAVQIGGALRSTSDELRTMATSSSSGSMASEVTTQLASGLGRAADRLDEGGLQAVVEDVERYARRHPGRFLIGAAVAGFAVGRLVQHSDTSALQRAMQQGMGGDGGDGSGGGGSDATSPAFSTSMPSAVPGGVR